MFAARLISFAFLLCPFVPPIFAEMWYFVLDDVDALWCYDTERDHTELTRECHIAIDMIPEGLVIDPDRMQRMGRDASGRIILPLDKRRYVLPASFRSGNCLVSVFREPYDTVYREPFSHVAGHRDAAATLYFNVWPQARKAATEIVQRCVASGKEGRYWTETAIGNSRFVWSVRIEHKSAVHRVLELVPPTNIYIARPHPPIPP